jgi:arabinose-5-phosphate isomerase
MEDLWLEESSEASTSDPSGTRDEAIQADIHRVLMVESRAIQDLAEKLDQSGSASRCVELLLECRGRVIVTGMGKAGLVARKMAATFASTGTPAFYLHPADALHGDLGVITSDDVVVVLSNSGETEEVLALLPHLKRFQVPIIALTGNSRSTLARHSDVMIDVTVREEADPLGVAPTASTTAAMAMGDALAVALLRQRNFTPEQFGIFHPGGNLGRKLLWRVSDLMHMGDQVPLVLLGSDVRSSIFEMTAKRLGATFIVDDGGTLVGIFTDGDLRRLLQREPNPLELLIDDVMIRQPKTMDAEALAAEALPIFERHQITVLPVVDSKVKPIGALHLHDLVKAGLA